MLSDQSRNQNDAVTPQVSVDTMDGRTVISLSGRWLSHSVSRVDAQMRKLQNQHYEDGVNIDMSQVQTLDTAGAWLIERLRQSLPGGNNVLSNVNPDWQPLLDEVGKAVEKTQNYQASKRTFFLTYFFDLIGRGVFSGLNDLKMAMYILGSTIRGSQMKAGSGSSINLAAITHQMQMMGVGAVPIIVLMSSIVGAIIAQQGAFQLRYFGAEIFVVDLVGILVLRELGVLLTAIMIAGRSGSAITAEIGSMKMREETDALQVIGLNPVSVLVFPRLVALVIMLPLLTIIADVAALAGAAFVAYFYSGISADAFLSRLHDAVALNTYFAGLIKAPFMAMIIGIIGSVEGLKVGGSAESLGRRVTASVVKSIFIVIVVDGLFAIFYAAIDF